MDTLNDSEENFYGRIESIAKMLMEEADSVVILAQVTGDDGVPSAFAVCEGQRRIGYALTEVFAETLKDSLKWESHEDEQ